MSIYHDEIEIEDFEYDEDDDTYYYPCPCGDSFQITKVINHMEIFKSELIGGLETATCPSCSLVVKVIYDLDKFKADQEELTKESNQKTIETN